MNDEKPSKTLKTRKPRESKKNLENGTNSTEKFSLSSEDVCNIIRVCSEYGVTSLSFKDLRVDFGSKQIPLTPKGEDKAEPEQQQPAPPATPKKPNSEAKISDEQTQIAEEQLREQERELRREQIAELQLTNPLAAEEMIWNEELDDVDDEHGDE